MAYRKLGRTIKHRRAMLSNLTRSLIKHEKIETLVAVTLYLLSLSIPQENTSSG